MIKHHGQKQCGGGNGLYRFIIPRGQKSRGNLKEGTEVEAMEGLLVGLLSFLSYCNEDHLWLEAAPPTVDCTLGTSIMSQENALHLD